MCVYYEVIYSSLHKKSITICFDEQPNLSFCDVIAMNQVQKMLIIL